MGGGKYEGYSIMNFVLLYLLGRLYKLHPTIVSTKTICYLLFFSVCLTFVLNIIGINLFGMKISTKYFWAYCSPWILATSSMILILFSRLKIGECKLITYLASSSLSVYLLHENSLINSYTYIKPLRYLETKIDNDFIFVLSLFCYACLLYLLVSFIDILRQNVQTFILNSFEKNKYYSIVNGKILKIFNK